MASRSWFVAARILALTSIGRLLPRRVSWRSWITCSSFRDPSRTSRIAASFEDADLEDAAKQITLGMAEPRAKAWTEALFTDWKNYDGKALANKLAWVLRNTSSWRIVGRWPDELQKLTMPVRIFAIQGDTVHPWDTAQTMARTIKGARLSPRVQSLSTDALATQWVDALTA